MDGSDPADKARFRPVVVVPTYNNAASLRDVLRRLSALSLPIIIVNDGSTDATAAILAEAQSHASPSHLTVLTHDLNRGKAAALRTAFDAAGDAGFTHAATVDSDGQLDPEEIPELLAAARDCPLALVLGQRDYSVDGLPRTRLAGWYTTSLGVWLETGILVRDTQCGLRVYPLRLFEVVRPGAARFGMESEIIARAVWAGCPIVEVPATCHYFSEGGVSHFRPWRDGVHQFLMHAKLTLRRLNPWPHQRLQPPAAPGTKGRIPLSEGAAGSPLRAAGRPVMRPRPFRPFRDMNPVVLWAQLRESRLHQLIVAGAFGIGMFLASLPLWILHMPLGLYAAARLRIHWLPVAFGTSLVWTPLHEALSRTGITLGHWLIRWRGPDWEEADAAGFAFASMFGRFPLEWILGGIIVAFLMNWITIGTLMLLFRVIPVRESNTLRKNSAPTNDDPLNEVRCEVGN